MDSKWTLDFRVRIEGLDDNGDPSLKPWSGHLGILTPRGQKVVDRQEDDVTSPPRSSPDGMGSPLEIEGTTTSAVDLSGIDEIVTDDSFEEQVMMNTQRLGDMSSNYRGVQDEGREDSQTQDDLTQDTESSMVGDERVVPYNATVVPSSGKKSGVTGQTDIRRNDDDGSQDARVHHGDDLISNVRHDGGHRVPVSGVEDDIVVTENTTAKPWIVGAAQARTK